MNVLICDDEPVFLEQVREHVQAYLAQRGIVAHLDTATDPRQVMDSQTAYTLAFLDIQMEGLTGMELAQSLRRRGDRVSIIFVTGCEDYLPQGYSVQPIHFLLKPVSREALSAALRTDWELNHKPKTAVLRIGSKTVSLMLSEIRYIESYNHNIIIHQTEGDRTCVFSLTEFERQMPPNQFCRCHNSYLVNMAYVEEIGRTELSLRGGVGVPIGRAYYKSLQSAFIRYINQ